MVRRAAWLAALMLLAVFAFLGSSLRADTAWADEPGPEFVVPTDMATEPVLPTYESCAEALPLEPLETEDAAAAQVYELRREANRSCRVQVERLDQIVTRQWWVVSQLLGQQAKAKQIEERLEAAEGNDLDRNELLRELNNQFIPGPLKTELTGIDTENPLPVTGDSEAEYTLASEELVASVDASGEAARVALWFIAGSLVAGSVGYGLYRLVDRTT